MAAGGSSVGADVVGVRVGASHAGVWSDARGLELVVTAARLVGQVYALFVLTVAAAEAAVGLAIIVVYYRNRGSIGVEDVNMMKG